MKEWVWIVAGCVLGAVAARADSWGKLLSDEPYGATPPAVVDRMLSMVDTGPGDTVYDLGCGDGRIVIAAALRGARGVCVEREERLVQVARGKSRAAGVEDRITFIRGDLFEVPLHDASVVTVFLMPELNSRLAPKLRRELRPGARVVSYVHDFGAWRPDLVQVVESPAGWRSVFAWVVR